MLHEQFYSSLILLSLGTHCILLLKKLWQQGWEHWFMTDSLCHTKSEILWQPDHLLPQQGSYSPHRTSAREGGKGREGRREAPGGKWTSQYAYKLGICWRIQNLPKGDRKCWVIVPLFPEITEFEPEVKTFKIKPPQISSDWPWEEMAATDSNGLQCLRRSVKINLYLWLDSGEKKSYLKIVSLQQKVWKFESLPIIPFCCWCLLSLWYLSKRFRIQYRFIRLIFNM